MIQKVVIIWHFFSSFYLLTCSSGKKGLNDVEIIIDHSMSRKIDLKNETLIIFYFERDPLSVKFHLTDKERRKIEASYVALNLQFENTHIIVHDSCIYSPKLFTKVYFRSKESFQTITIDTGCDNYLNRQILKPVQLKKFIDVVNRIVLSKQEVIEAPSSDIIYY